MSKTNTCTPVHIRWMIKKDVQEVLDIETASFAESWQEEDLLRELRQRNVIGMVAEVGEKIAGYMVYGLEKSKLHIIKLAVDQDRRRAWVGTQLVSKLVSKLSSHNRTHITMEVDERNLDGQRFLKACGFKAVRVLPDHYGNGEDAYLFQYHLNAVADEPFEEGVDYQPVNRLAEHMEEA